MEPTVVAAGIFRAEKQSSIYVLETAFAKFDLRELLLFLEAELEMTLLVFL